MVFIKILGILDLLAAAIIMLEGYTQLPIRLTLIAAAYLILKWTLFWKNITSIIDALLGVLALLLWLFNWPILAMAAGIHLALKGAISLL
ncbi:MAG: hypothetical protein HC945_03405 [Nitrosarchaeum sp.]|nr:hypothetical protein [Nitrosarchaeum sp.]